MSSFQISLNLGEIIGLASLLVPVFGLAFYFGRLEKRVSHVENEIKVSKHRLTSLERKAVENFKIDNSENSKMIM